MGLRNNLKNYFVKSRGKTHIEAEEVFLDSEAIRSMEEKGKMEKPISSRNFIIFFGVILLALMALWGRSGYLQVAQGEYYSRLAQGNRLSVYSLPPPRGIIYDKDQKPLVYNVPNFEIIVNINDFLKKPEASQKEDLKKILEIIQEKDSNFTLRQKKSISGQVGVLIQRINNFKKKGNQLVLIPDIDRSAALIIESKINEWSGIRVEEVPRRKYLEGKYFAHILGYTGRINLKELKKHPDYSLNDHIGKTGIEKQYEEILKGEAGKKQIEVNSLGETQKVVGLKKPQPGNNLILSVDKDLQKKIQDSLNEVMGRLSGGDNIKKAAAVAMNPQNGKILAAVSLPSFNNNLFTGGISQEKLDELENNPANPFLTRFNGGQYPPGSLIKPLVAAAGLSEDAVNPRKSVECQGSLAVTNKYTGQVRHFNDWKTHGKTDMIKAIAESCNVYFYTLGGGYEEKEGLGVEVIEDYLHKFGLEKETQIDLPQEKKGFIPDKDWKRNVKEEEWFLGDTYNLSIGQGDVLVTPLQITNALSAIANGGTLYQPRILDKIVDSNKKPIRKKDPRILNENFLKKEDVNIVREGMRQTVKSGSASRLNSLNVPLAGKTGTAQFGSQDKTHSWFSVFGPYEEPEIILTVLVEGAGGAGDAAVPVAEKVLKWYFK